MVLVDPDRDVNVAHENFTAAIEGLGSRYSPDIVLVVGALSNPDSEKTRRLAELARDGLRSEDRQALEAALAELRPVTDELRRAQENFTLAYGVVL